MAKIIISIIIGILLLVSPVMAQDEIDIAGITPDSFLWEIDIFIERIQMMITRPENKADFGLQIANERLAEMKKMMEQNKIQAMNKAEVERDEIIEEVEMNSRGLSEEHRELVSEKLQKHIQVLERVRGEVPEQAKLGLENAIEKSSQVLERIRLR